MTIKRIGLLVSGIASFLVLACMAPADATVTSSGNGVTLSVVHTQLVNHNTGVNVWLTVTCNPSPTNAGMFSIINFTLSQNVNHAIVSYQGGTGNSYPPITCDGTSHLLTFKVVPQNCTNSCPFFEAGPAYIANGNVAAFPTDTSCGTTVYGGQTVPLPCDNATFSGGVQIKS